jgi:hypothetical protein
MKLHSRFFAPILFVAALVGFPLWIALSPSARLIAQGNQTGASVEGIPVNRSTVNGSITITTGNTFQTVLASNLTTQFGQTVTPRYALTIENNNASDSCWLYLGNGTATKAISILLLPGGSYTRYWPFVPSDQIQATCSTTSDTLYVDTQ